MNRLILLGNGFDLAHGMKTSYNDFILWYLVSSMESAENQIYSDGVITVKKGKGQLSSFRSKTISDYVNLFYNKGNLKPLFSAEMISYDGGRTSYRIPYHVTVHSEFMESLFLDCSICNWVDIENKYYSALKDALKSNDKEKIAGQLIEKLNETMFVLTKNLERYFKTQTPSQIYDGFENIFWLPLQENEVVHWAQVEQKKIEKTLFLNFNYTPTIQAYTNSLDSQLYDFQINYIHGELDNPENLIIFGFGDELDQSYKNLEESKKKGLFKYIKSFSYFKTRNYRNLIRYIESGQFQVFILGHSCGLSDRTMLNMIFEHDNCMSIKIYYHQIDKDQNNYTELTEEISRHFVSKRKMRERIVPFQDSEPMKQVESGESITMSDTDILLSRAGSDSNVGIN